MKKIYFYAAAAMALASCASDDYTGENGNPLNSKAGEIAFTSVRPGVTRGDIMGAAAAELLGNAFVVEGVKGTEQTNNIPSTPGSGDPTSYTYDVVFDNYLVEHEMNSANKTESNTNNWEYVGKTHAAIGTAPETTIGRTVSEQSIKYWDYSKDQYSFVAFSTGKATMTAGNSNNAVIGSGNPWNPGTVKVTKIALSNTGGVSYSFEGKDVRDLQECYITDITEVEKANYGHVVTLKFKNLTSKIRVGLYETVPGYSVKDVKFYTSDANDQFNFDSGEQLTAGTSLVGYYTKDSEGKYTACTSGTADGSTTYYKMVSLKPATETTAALFTSGEDVIPASGTINVTYPSIGTSKQDAKDYNKAAVTVSAGDTKVTKLEYGALNYSGKDKYELDESIYLGRTLPNATMAGSSSAQYYTPVMPNNNAKTLTLRVDYTLVSTDGSGEEIKVYGAKAVVPSTYTEWKPNYAYTYIFKISDNTNGWTSTVVTDPQGLFPITFDAVVTEMTDFNAEQTTITTVATPSITTYQQGHVYTAYNEYSKSQKAGVSTDVKDLYVQVMDNSTTPATLVSSLSTTNALLYKLDNANATEAMVMDALVNQASENSGNITGRNALVLTKNSHIDATVTSIVNGVDDNPITKINGTDISAGQVAVIDIDHSEVPAGTYAFVYDYTTSAKTVTDKCQPITVGAVGETVGAGYYPLATSSITTEVTTPNAKAEESKLYFSKTTNGTGTATFSFVTTEAGVTPVTGLWSVDKTTVTGATATTADTTVAADTFYFQIYKQNDGKYAVKVIKVVA